MNISLSWSTKKGVAIVALSAMLFAGLLSGALTASADSLSVLDSGTLDSDALEYVSSVDASGYENLVFSFDYNAEELDNGDSFTYGWRDAEGDHSLGTVSGIDEDGTTTPDDETDTVSVSLPVEAQIANLELYISATVDSGSDTVSLSNMALDGDVPEAPLPTNVASVNGTEYETVQAAVDAADPGDTVTLLADIELEEQITITKSLTLDGDEHTLTHHYAFTENGVDNAIIGINNASDVTIKDVVVDGTGGAHQHGINVFGSTNVTIDNVEVKNNTKSGLNVNSSSVTVNNIKTSGNAWHGIDLDVAPASLTVNGTSEQGEEAPIPQIFIDDITTGVVFTDTNNQYEETAVGNARVYTLKSESSAPSETIDIHNVDELHDAIENQEDGQTWTIHAGDYALDPMTGVEASGQTGWYFPITANDITIQGEGNPVLYGAGFTKNGAWSTQDLVAVFGDNVTIKGLTLMPKVEPNKTLEVIGSDFTIEDVTFLPNTKVDPSLYDGITDPQDRVDLKEWGGSLYFNHEGTHTVKNVTIYNGGVSFRYSATSTHISFENVSIVDETNVDWINAYRFSSGFNNPDTSIIGVPTITYRASAELNNLDSILANVKAGDVIEFGDGTYAQDLNIDKGITLKAAADSTPVIQGKILISASDVSIDGLTITNPSFAGGQTIHGVQIWSAGPVISNINLTNNTFTNIANSSTPVKGAYGIMVQGHVSDVTIDSNTIDGIHSSGWARGIEVTPTCSDTSVVPAHVTISNNTVSDIVSETGDAYALSVDAATCGETVVPANAGEVTISGNDFQGEIRDLDPDHDINGVINPPSDEEDDDVTLDSDTEGEVTVEDDTIVLSNTSNLDLSSGIVTSGEQNTVTLNSGSAPEVIITNSDDSTAQVTIQNGTTITTDAGWNGTFIAPQQVSATGITPAGFQIGDTVIEVGAPGHKLTLDAPATIFLPGVRGPVGYKAGDSDTWVRIEASCSGTFEAPVLPDGEQQCHKADSTGTKILTLSFSSFAALTVEGSSGGSSSGGTRGTRVRAAADTTTEPAGRVLGASTVAVAHVFASEMGNGASGDEVSALQAFLIARGYLQIAAPTGYFGPMTEAALKLYQGSKGISATGYFGPLTLAAVNGEQQTSADVQIATLRAQLDVLVKELQTLLDAQK